MHPVKRSYRSEFDFPVRNADPLLTYMIATLPRSGSTLLSAMLWQSGNMGAPLEYPNVENHRELIQEYGEGNFLKYWKQVMQRRTSPNGVFGFKMFTQFYHDIRQEGPGAIDVLKADKVIRLKRREKLAHAISYSRALKTQQWFSGLHTGIKDEFDGNHIEYCLELIQRQEASWDAIFHKANETPLTIYYEDLILDPIFTMKTIEIFLSVPTTLTPVLDVYVPSMQSDALSLAWQKIYPEFLSRRDRSEPDTLI